MTAASLGRVYLRGPKSNLNSILPATDGDDPRHVAEANAPSCEGIARSEHGGFRSPGVRHRIVGLHHARRAATGAIAPEEIELAVQGHAGHIRPTPGYRSLLRPAVSNRVVDVELPTSTCHVKFPVDNSAGAAQVRARAHRQGRIPGVGRRVVAIEARLKFPAVVFAAAAEIGLPIEHIK